MTKKIEQLQRKILEAQANRERKKIRYDAHVVILEGQRDTLRNLEEMNRNLLDEYVKVDRTIGEMMTEIQKLTSEEEEK